MGVYCDICHRCISGEIIRFAGPDEGICILCFPRGLLQLSGTTIGVDLTTVTAYNAYMDGWPDITTEHCKEYIRGEGYYYTPEQIARIYRKMEAAREKVFEEGRRWLEDEDGYEISAEEMAMKVAFKEAGDILTEVERAIVGKIEGGRISASSA